MNIGLLFLNQTTGDNEAFSAGSGPDHDFSVLQCDSFLLLKEGASLKTSSDQKLEMKRGLEELLLCRRPKIILLMQTNEACFHTNAPST